MSAVTKQDHSLYAAMGAALSSHGLDDPQHRELLAEFVGHSKKELEECAQIFRGSIGRDDEYVSSRARKSSQQVIVYPRHLHFPQFEEVFGMLVADAEPHFEFFEAEDCPRTACAHQVFCALALVMNADLHAKVTFILRLYADRVGLLSSEKKRLAISDFMLALQLILNMSDEIPRDVLSAIEVCVCFLLRYSPRQRS